MQELLDLFGQAQQALFEGVVQPLVFALGAGNLLEDAFRATGWLLVGVVQIVLLVTVLGTLERWRPVEPVTDRRGVRVDVLYTLLHRLGLFRVAMFFTLDAAGLRERCRGQMADYKVPRHVAVLPDFPRTSTGKIQRAVLQAQAREQVGQGGGG